VNCFTFAAIVSGAARHYALVANTSQIKTGSLLAPVFFLSYRKQHAVPVPPETLPPIALDWRKLGEVHKGARQTLDKG